MGQAVRCAHCLRHRAQEGPRRRWTHPQQNPDVPHTQPLILSVQDMRATIKFQLRKVTCMGVAAGRQDMDDKELQANIMMSLNFLVSLLKKGWHNLKSVHIKMSMGPAVKLL